MDQINNQASPVSPEGQLQVQTLVEQYHRIADQLHLSTTREQAAVPLGPINEVTEEAQLALLKALGKEHHSDAADVVNAIYEFSPNKNVRKEARRTLIRLEGAKVHPKWNPPAEQSSIVQLTTTTNAPRFWKGVVTRARESGEVQLVLCWEQGANYSEVRAFLFLLDFWQEGVKDFYVNTGTRRHIDEQISKAAAKTPDIRTTDCTLAEGKRLLEEALSVNKWRATAPHKDYRINLPTLNQLIFQATDTGEDRGHTFIDPELEPEDVVVNFIGAWSLGDYGLAYDLLSRNSDLREGLSRDEWIAGRRAWANEALPARLELGMVREQEIKQSAIWVPTASGRNATTRKDIVTGWSLELTSTPLSGTLKEMPMGTSVNKITGRHWFWTSFRLTQEENVWRIQSMTDEGASAQGLAINELQKRIKEHDDRAMEILQKPQPNLPMSEANKLLEEIFWRITEALAYDDALIAKLPLDRTQLENAYNHAKGLGANERVAVYLERMAKNFSELRGNTLRELGLIQANLGQSFGEQGLAERAEEFFALAENSMRDSVEVDHEVMGYVLQAEIILSHNSDQPKRVAEAEALLEQARTLSPTEPEETVIEVGMGNVALKRGLKEEALAHFQRAASISHNYPGIWFVIGHLLLELERIGEAEENLKRSIEETPEDLRAHTDLGAIYLQDHLYKKAREVFEQGLRANPDSVHLRALLASAYLEEGDRRNAQAWLEEAESLNPEAEIVKVVRQAFNKAKKK